MKTKEYALPVGYSFSVGAVNASVPNSDNIQYDIGSIDNGEGTRIYATAVDSRHFTAQCFKDIPILPYHKPSLFIKTKRKNDFENETKIEINGEMSSLIVDNERKNKILSLKMRYKEVNGIFSEYINLEPVMDEYRYSINPYFLDLDREKQYLIEVTVTDKLSTTVQNVVVVRGIAIFFISTDRETCYIKDKEVVTKDNNDIAYVNGLYNKSGSTLVFDADTTVENNDWVLTNDNGNVKRRNISRDLDGRGTFDMNENSRHLDFDNTDRRRHLLTAESMAWWNGCYNQNKNGNYSNLEYFKRGKILASPKVVFFNGNGDNSNTINFDENIKNAKRIDIYFKDTSNNWLSTSLINPIGKDIILQAVSCSGGRNSMKYSSTVYRVDENKMNVVDKGVSYSTGGYWKNNEIYVYEIDIWNKYYLEQEH